MPTSTPLGNDCLDRRSDDGASSAMPVLTATTTMDGVIDTMAWTRTRSIRTSDEDGSTVDTVVTTARSATTVRHQSLADNNLPNDDGTDTDGDGACDAGDGDDDNDGVWMVDTSDHFDPAKSAARTSTATAVRRLLGRHRRLRHQSDNLADNDPANDGACDDWRHGRRFRRRRWLRRRRNDPDLNGDGDLDTMWTAEPADDPISVNPDVPDGDGLRRWRLQRDPAQRRCRADGPTTISTTDGGTTTPATIAA